MRDFLNSSGRWFRGNWFWPLVLLALPNCSSVLGIEDWESPVFFDAGPEPRTSAIMCDIAKPPGAECSAPGDTGTLLTQAAVALRNGGGANSIGLNDSPDELNACGTLPRKTAFHGPFPAGFQVCLNASTQIPAVYPDSKAVCIARCRDLVNLGGVEPKGGTDAFCKANARVSTNFAEFSPFANVCSSAGTPVFFVDPRGTPENVKWTAQDLIGVCLADVAGTCGAGGNLMRTADTTGTTTSDFNAGGASDQVITHGDGWVEFAARETNLSHVLGLRSTPCNTDPCKDADPSLDDPDPGLTDMSFAISLNADGNVYVIESDGFNLTVLGPFGPYAANERFRVHFDDNFDGTASISYWRVDETGGPCIPNQACVESQFGTQTLPSPTFPLRVDVSFREKDAMVKDVTLVRIKDQ